MSDRLADIKARISVRNTLGIGRAETPYDEVAREVVWLVAEVARLQTELEVGTPESVVESIRDDRDQLRAALAALRQRHAEAMAILRSLVVTDVHICHGHPCERCLRLTKAKAAPEASDD